MEGPPYKLLEAAAQAICERVLAEEPRVAALRVHVRKPHVALRGPLESIGAVPRG
jgi:dihydroneopterin aldolase